MLTARSLRSSRMGYVAAFEAAGAIVHDSQWFGSYQGDVIADVTYEGKRGILVFGFGSCGGCDAFDAEFDGTRCYDHYNNDAADCGDCVSYQARLVAFGRDYLNGVMTLSETLAYRERLVEQSEWDSDASEQIAYLDSRLADIAAEGN